MPSSVSAEFFSSTDIAFATGDVSGATDVECTGLIASKLCSYGLVVFAQSANTSLLWEQSLLAKASSKPQ